jgi:cell wall-associated NlpC family hydrolase
MTTEERRDLAIKIAWSFLGLPYLWGGDDPIEGFDCSGFIVEILKGVGIIPHAGDWSADALWQKFKMNQVASPAKGVLVFWGSDRPTPFMTHIEMCIDEEHTIGSSGGGSKTIDRAAAIAQNAYIKVRPVNYRGGVRVFADPFI